MDEDYEPGPLWEYAVLFVWAGSTIVVGAIVGAISALQLDRLLARLRR